MLDARYMSERVRRSAIHLMLKSPDSLEELINLALLMLDHYKQDVRRGLFSQLLQLRKENRPKQLRWENPIVNNHD